MGVIRTMSIKLAAVGMASSAMLLIAPGAASADSPWDGVKPRVTPVTVELTTAGAGLPSPDDSLWD